MEFSKQSTSSMYPTYRVQIAPTSLSGRFGGEALIVVTDADHIHFDANHHCANGRPGDRCWIRVRDIEYGASLHFKRMVGGEWQVIDRPYVTRVNTFKDASPAAVVTVSRMAREIVQEFVSQHGIVLAQARTAAVKREIDQHQEELEAARARVAELEKRGSELAREFQVCITLEQRAK